MEKVYCIFRQSDNCSFCGSEELILIFREKEKAETELKNLEERDKTHNYYIVEYPIF